MEQTPEELRQERERALRSLQTNGVPPPPHNVPQQPEAQNPAAAGWKAPNINLNQVTEAARHMDTRDPLSRSMQVNDDDAWETRAHQLIDTEEDGTPKAPSTRSIDMETASEYGERSKNAIIAINKYFSKIQCSEIHFNAPDKIFAKVNGERVQIKAEFTNEEEYNHFIEDLIRRADTHKTFNEIKLKARDVVRMAGGDRMAILMPPLTETIQAAIHKVVARTWNIDTLVENGTLTPQMAKFLQACVQSKVNILVCGEMGAGKTVLLSLLAQEIGDNERVALIEEVPEIFLDKPDVSRITYYPESTSDTAMGLAEVLDTVLYMRMDRVLIGEIHDKGMYRMLRVMAAGSDGSLSTFHAGSAEQALEQVRNHVLLEHGSIPSHVATHFIRQAVNLVVVAQRVGGQHRIKEIVEVEWRNLVDGNETIGRNLIFRYDPKSQQYITESRPDEKGKIQEKAAKYGVNIAPEWFATGKFGQRDRS